MKPVALACGITLSPETVRSLAAAHVGHFAELLDLAPRGGVNVAETRYYLDLWKGVRAAMARGVDLGSEQLRELHDAVTSREYDALLQPDELLAVIEPARRAS